MKRRVLTQALLMGLVRAPALAADPLPKMQETPSLVDRVKSGALPPVDKRIPRSPGSSSGSRAATARASTAASSTC